MATAPGVSGPAFVVLRREPDGQWTFLGEFARRRGLPARAARSAAIQEATRGGARAGETYAAVLRSEWRIAQDWAPPAG
jgi:hypothetical protein